MYLTNLVNYNIKMLKPHISGLFFFPFWSCRGRVRLHPLPLSLLPLGYGLYVADVLCKMSDSIFSNDSGITKGSGVGGGHTDF